MRKTLLVGAATVALLGMGVGPAMACGTPQRPAGQVQPVKPSGNGGDNGWGNCGHNSSVGNPHSGANGKGGGNGGYKKGDDCKGGTTDPGSGSTDPGTTDPGTGGTTDPGTPAPTPAPGDPGSGVIFV